MSTYTPFFCRVAAHGTPFFVPLEASSNTFFIRDLAAADVCHYYWLLESVTIAYKMTFEGLVVQGNLFLGSYAPVPRQRLLAVPPFYASQFLSSYGIQTVGELNFSKVYLQEDGQLALAFNFTAYSRDETVGGSQFLLCLERSEGDNGQRNAYKTKAFNIFGGGKTAYLNYNNQIWGDSGVALNEFSMAAVFYDNGV
ncbi:MAG: hypothetical protein LBG09_03040 [Puniceicoccales bacterium]|jgi:hypothetical protein|nr:hypothetical protein [Puniceicoccales bacterium]